MATSSVAPMGNTWKPCLRKGAATSINTLILLALIAVTPDRAMALLLFFAYCLGTDLICGRCLGMMVLRTHWIGHPNIMQKLVYNSSYSVCFGFMLVNEIVCASIIVAQVVAILGTGKTTHGLLANMNSERDGA